MSFGAVFLPADSRLQANLYKLNRELVEEEIRSKIKPPNKDLDRVTQQIGRRYGAGSADPRVLDGVRLRKKKFEETFNEPVQGAAPGAKYDHRKPLKIGAPLPYMSPNKADAWEANASAAAATSAGGGVRFHALDPTAVIRYQQRQQPHGRYAVDAFEPYESRFQNAPSESSYNLNTPKMWPPDVQYPSIGTRSAAIPSVAQDNANTFFYNSNLRKLPETHSWGHKAHSQSLQTEIAKRVGSPPRSPLMTGSPCSKAAPAGAINATSKFFLTVEERQQRLLERQQREQKDIENATLLQEDMSSSHLQMQPFPDTVHENSSLSGTTTASQIDSQVTWSLPPTHGLETRKTFKEMKNISNSTVHQPTNEMSALQSALAQCGKLVSAEKHYASSVEPTIQHGVARQLQVMLNHAQWMQQDESLQGMSRTERSKHFQSLYGPSFDKMQASASDSNLVRVSVNSEPPEKRRLGRMVATHKKQVRAAEKQAARNAEAKRKEEERIAQLIAGGHHHLYDAEGRSVSSRKSGGYSVLTGTSTKQSFGSKPAESSGASFSNNQSASSQNEGGIHLTNMKNSKNPFRVMARSSSQVEVSHCKRLPRQPTAIAHDPLSYKGEASIRAAGNFNAVIKPDVAIGQVPSKSEVNEALINLTRKTMLSYNTRIVEVGAALKALKDPRHETPGLQAVQQLHDNFVDAAAVNPNNWLLNRAQMREVISRNIPWHPPAAQHRLLLSFDAQNTGLIRYVRVSCTMLCALQPAMIELASTMNRVRERIRRNESIGQSVQDYLGELIVISLIHSLYESCSGRSHLKVIAAEADVLENDLMNRTFTGSHLRDSTAKNSGHEGREEVKPQSLLNSSTASKTVTAGSNVRVERVKPPAVGDREAIGMHLQDFVEAFCCCAVSIEDEMKIGEMAAPVMQYLFVKNIKEDVLADAYLQRSNRRLEEDFTTQQRALEIERQLKEAANHSNWQDDTQHDGSMESIDKFLGDYYGYDAERGPKLLYRYRNGEMSLTTGTTQIGQPIAPQDLNKSLVRKPLRRVGAGNSIEDLINNPQEWREKLNMRNSKPIASAPATMNLSSPKIASPSGPHRKSLVEGGNSLAWTATGDEYDADSPVHGKTTASNAAASSPPKAESAVHVQEILKYGSIKTVKHLPRFSQDDLIMAMRKYPEFLIEFIRQVRSFRRAAGEYILKGSSSIEDSIKHFQHSEQ